MQLFQFGRGFLLGEKRGRYLAAELICYGHDLGGEDPLEAVIEV